MYVRACAATYWMSLPLESDSGSMALGVRNCNAGTSRPRADQPAITCGYTQGMHIKLPFHLSLQRLCYSVHVRASELTALLDTALGQTQGTNFHTC